MTIHPLPTASAYDEHTEQIGHTRDQLLTEIADGISSFQRAYEQLAQLRGPVEDAEFVDGRDGRDVARFLDDGIRIGRAAYAVVHTIIDKEIPR
ncbi:hypothetical protein H7J71_02260 [Mycolicibacterium peregrinum]|uniref:hypothetical protein n=1 Tax=Mycolicibacterium peregrinum TaxID=43304 RepID=UPI0006D7C36B|nr:hypothetical protein [Mycolicibacterium peregrinum]MCV7200835.1 hypothetical protein [Mycolicibacterium peregrinum]ORW49779.1 hypothetical protein AWC21_01775 [Mycolicibacterium peregrinum]